MAAHPDFTINNSAWGTVTWTKYGNGWEASIHANPGYYLKSWSFIEKFTGWGYWAGEVYENTYGWTNGNTDQVSGYPFYTGPTSSDIGGWNSTVTAAWIEFAQIPDQTYTVSLRASPGDYAGVVSGGGTYAGGSTCTVVATPSIGWRFVRWTEYSLQISTSATYSFTVNRSRGLVAVFEQETPGEEYEITTTPSPSEGGTTSGDGTYAAGASCTVVATPAEGWRFVRWTEGGSQVSTSATYSFAVSRSRDLVAEFKERPKITATPDPPEGGTASGGGYFDPGQTCTVVATPADGWEFVRWSEDGEEVATTARYSFTVSASRDLVAEFTREFTVTFNRLGTSWGICKYSEPEGGTESIKIKYGDPWPSIEVPTAKGYTLGGYYTGGPGEIGLWNPYATKWYNADGSPVNEIFRGVEDMTLDALWMANRYDLTIDPNGGIYAFRSSHQSSVPVVFRGELMFGGVYHYQEYAAKREGYVFLGYYTQPYGGEQVYRPDPDNPIEEETPEGEIIDYPAVVGVEGAYWSQNGGTGTPGRWAYLHDGPLVVYARWKHIPTHLILRNDAGVIMRSATSGVILRDD